jgi:drug/metabolite transporter (DMT)-like permease
MEFAMLLTLSLCWGSSFMFIKLALADFGPLSMASTRIFISAIALFLLVLAKGHRLPTEKGVWKTMFIAGFFGTTLPFAVVSWGQQHIDSGTAAILMAFTPIATVIIAHIKTDNEKITPIKVIGITLSLFGVFVLLGGGSMAGDMIETFSQLAVLLAAICYAISSLYIRKLNHLPAIVCSAGVLIASAIITVPFSFIFDPIWALDIHTTSMISVLYLSLISSGLAVYLMTHMINTSGMTFMAYNNFLVPAIGVLWGVIFLDEKTSLYTFIALGLILAGIIVATMVKPKKMNK